MDIQTQVQDKQQEMLADRLMDRLNEMFYDITGSDDSLTHDIIRLICADLDIYDLDALRERIRTGFIVSLGPSYESYCQQLVLDDIAAEDQYQKAAAIDMEIEQRRLG